MNNKYQIAFGEFLNIIQPRDQKYYKSLYCGAIKFGNDKFLLLEKKKVVTEFRFSDEGESFKTFCKVTASEKAKIAHFKAENLAKFNINHLHDDSFICKMHVSFWDDNVVELYFVKQRQPDNSRKPNRELTAAEIAEIDNGMAFARAEHEKRLDTHLNRNGLSKMRFNTYYADI